MNRGKPQAPDVSVQQTVAPVVKEPVAPGDPTKPLTPVKDYMASAILVTIFCFLPTGLYAIFQAYAANEAAARSDWAAYQLRSTSARSVIKVSIIVGCVLAAIVVVVFVAYFAIAAKYMGHQDSYVVTERTWTRY